MALTSSERQRLAEIEADLTETAPAWAALFTAADACQALRRHDRRPLADAAAAAAALLGVALLIAGCAAALAALITGGAVLACVGVVAVLNRRADTLRRQGGHPPR